jgi:diguanylate cyclase (GGDEF)-like protein/PAS domain S-box-containing protein
MRARSTFRPLAASGRRPAAAILLTFALCSAVSVTLSVRAISRSQHRAAVLQVAARQRMLAEEYVQDVLVARAGGHTDPATVGRILARSAGALLNGGLAPAMPGDDDETTLSPATGSVVRRQLAQERRLVADLDGTGAALLAGRPVSAVPLTAGEHLPMADPLQRLRVLAALTSNVSLDAARTIGAETDANVNGLVELQFILGGAGLLVSLLLALGLIAATRRQTAHLRSIVTASTDLVVVLGKGGCRYVSPSVTRALGVAEADVLGEGLMRFLHPDDHALVRTVQSSGRSDEVVLRVANQFGEWRHLEAHVTDMRHDRHIRGVVINARDVSERVRLEEELTRQAYHDGLTALANRSLFRDRLDQALARAARTGDPLAVLVLDLDGFKRVNDTLGHDAGDRLLREVATRLMDSVRPSDTVARFGGDEFAMLLEDADESLASEVARRSLARLAEPVVIAERQLAVAASIGIVVHTGEPVSGDDLVRDADVAMYAAKDAGRGRHEVFCAEMARGHGELLGLEHELRTGLHRHEFRLHYQPEIDLATGGIVGVEALMRWTSPTRGPVSPGRFIPAAEASGLIAALGEFALREACLQTVRWLRAGLLSDTFVTWVNVSGKQLSMGGVPAAVTRALEAAGLPAHHLGLEVTETAIVEGGAADRAREELQQLHGLGVRVAIDDFGTGFSSLAQLRHLPVDMIKVDRSFIQGVDRDPKDAAITANVVSLAHALGLVAVAEGIESDGQLASVRATGCDVAQGYLFARPVAAREMTRVLAGGLDVESEAA